MSGRGIPFFFVALALVACEIPNPGIPPAAATLNFPIALGLSPPRPGGTSQFLLVVSSNYDARYNQGSILSLDMDAIMARFATVRDVGRAEGCTNPASWDDPSVECQIAVPADVMAGGAGQPGGEVWIDSFASGLVRSPQGDRFYLPTRGTSDLTWIDLDANGLIHCDQAPGSLRCADARRTTVAETGCPGRDVTLTGDPSALVAMSLDTLTGLPQDATRDVLLMVQRNGSAALYLDSTAAGIARQPVRTHVLTGLPPDAIHAELERSSSLAWVSTSSPVSTRATRVLARIGVFIDPQNEHCSQAFAAPSVFLDGIATGFDSRDVAFSSGDGRYAYVLSRAPESVITIDQNGTPFIPGNAPIVDVDDVGFGPSRMHRVTLGGHDFLVVSCFDGRALWILGTDPTQVVSIVPGFDGAFEMVIDAERELAIVADFRTSVIRFVDLSPLVHGRNAVVLGRVGTPRTHVGFP